MTLNSVRDSIAYTEAKKPGKFQDLSKRACDFRYKRKGGDKDCGARLSMCRQTSWAPSKNTKHDFFATLYTQQEGAIVYTTGSIVIAPTS